MFDFQNIVSSVAAPVLAGTNLVAKAISGLTDPVINRLQQSNLIDGGRSRQQGSKNVIVNYQDNLSGVGVSQDWKVRISVASGSGILYNSVVDSGILGPLSQSNGVIFPYTPEIIVTHMANYSPQKFIHSNYNQFAYENSEVQNIQISGDFTAQNANEAAYVLACIYFFRSATKMFFGRNSKNAGNPPPIVFLNGYGKHYFPNVPCIITNFSHAMPGEVDYISTSGELNYYEDELGQRGYTRPVSETRVPTISKITVNLNPVYSKSRISEFGLEDFAKGKLIDKGFV